MEGKTDKYSVATWRNSKKEKKNANKREYYRNNQEKLAEKARERMKRLRENRKLHDVTSLKGRGNVATRASSKGRISREKRADQVCAKKIERKREEEREEQRKEHKRRQTKERVRKFREKRKLANDARPESEGDCATPSAFPSRMAKKRARDKVTPTLPKSPRKKAEVVQTLANSLSTRGLLEKQGFLQSSVDKQDTEAMKSVVADLADGLAKVKGAKSTDQRAAYGVASSLTFGASVKKNRQQSRVAKLVGIKRQQVSKGISQREKVLKGDEACWIVIKRKVRMDAVKDEEKRLIYDYWTHQASRPTGSKKDKMHQRVRKGEYVEHAKHVLEKTQTECFQEFQQLHPEIKVKQRKFEEMKPYFVKGARERDRQSCLCRKHVECKMLFDSCMKFRKSPERSNEEQVPNFNFLSEVVDSTLCEKEEAATHHRLECTMQKCDDCGVKKLKLSRDEESRDVVVKWKRYDYVTVQDKNGQERSKIALINKETPVNEMFKYCLELLEGYTYHSFMAKWQKDEFDNLLANLPLNHVICVHDFSENYICRSQDEIQSQYFDPNKVSIHVTILYRHANLQTDGKESSEENPSIIKEHIFALSDDNTQDYHFVHHVQDLILHYLREENHLTVEKIHEFTDGCVGQYKSKHTFGDLSCCLTDF